MGRTNLWADWTNHVSVVTGVPVPVVKERTEVEAAGFVAADQAVRTRPVFTHVAGKFEHGTVAVAGGRCCTRKSRHGGVEKD